MSATRLGWLLAVALLASPLPVRAATVAVAPIKDGAGKRGEGDAVRKQVEHGLSDGGITVVGASALAAAAKKQGLNPADLGRPAVLMPVAQAVHADAVLQAVIAKAGKKDQELQIRVFNLDGVELWSRNIKMAKGKLANDVPKKIARAVTAAIAAAPAPSKGGTGETTTTPDATTTAPDTTTTPTPDTTTTPTPDTTTTPTPDTTTEVKPKKPKTDEGETAPDITPKRKHPKTDEGESTSHDEGESTIEGPPKEAKVDTTPQPPIIDFGLGLAFVSRSYNVCPGVTSCSQPGPQPTIADDGTSLDVPVTYKSTAPSFGFILHAELFPLPKLVPISDALTLTLGVRAEYLKTLGIPNNYNDPVTNQPGKFTSSMSRLNADVLGRLYFHMLNGTGYAGLYGGYLAPQFTVGENPLLAGSSRKGFDLGGETELPLAGDYVKFTTRVALALAANPGVEETTLYGESGKGSGFLLRAGFTGGYEYFGVSALFDFARFGDTFTNAGALTTNGAVAEETYTSVIIMAQGRY